MLLLASIQEYDYISTHTQVGKGDVRVGAQQNKTIIITGASDGIGAEAARILTEQGHKTVIIGRSAGKTRRVAESIGAPYYITDFTSLEQVRELGERLLEDFPRIDVLANNAGGMFGDRELTPDGHEKTFQVNHLAHFLLTSILLDRLVSCHATVINTSSIAHRLFARFDIKDLELEDSYSEKRAYGNAKLENILFTRELHRRFGDTGMRTAAFHPGNVATNFAHDSTSLLKFIYHTPLRHLAGLISPQKGADTLVWLATSQDWDSGEYYYKRKRAKVSAAALDDAAAETLWEKSAQFVGE
jgi:NAD(P)-dependent dehydrogenase (short-subunit alcohol dehydrogenase family)